MRKLLSFMILLIPAICYTNRLLPDEAYYVYNFFSKTEYKHVADIITSQAILESGWFKSRMHIKLNNYFSIKDWLDYRCARRPIYCLKKYKSLKHSCQGMYSYIKNKRYSTNRNNYYIDLKRKRYAKDPKYVSKLKSITKHIKYRLYYAYK
jgi:flagellum-specific peptidoglycan hydrolase FlgJ